jgi:hypothetical protein
MQQIALKDLDPQIAEKIKASANSIWGPHNHQPEDVSVRSVIMKRWKGKGWGVARPTILGSLTGLGIGVGLGALIGNPGAMGGLGFLGCYLGTLGTLFGSMAMRRKSVQTNMSAEELRAVMHIASLSPTEASYIEVVCSLLEASENIPEEIAREILQSLSILIEHYRHIDAQLERLKKVVGNESVEALEAEHSRLVDRTAQVDDPQAKEDMQQSLAMCEKRLQDVRVLAPSIERLEAQKEVLHQTLMTIQASVVRLQAAPRAVSLPDTTELRQAVDEVTIKTRAVEEAVAEVLVLQGK